MDFFDVCVERKKNKRPVIYPRFNVAISDDFMTRGRSFYAIWDDEKGMWSTNEFDVVKIVDSALYEYRDKMQQETGEEYEVLNLRNFSSNMWNKYKDFLTKMPDTNVQLDNKITFLDTPVSKSDYVSKRLPYSIKDGDISAYEEIMSTLYDPEERAKIEWAIGSVVSGDSTNIQKFFVFYGAPGTGKSTVLNIIQDMFNEYYTVFDAKALAVASSNFAIESFRSNPLIAIQQDGDLSKIEDNTTLNSIVSHDTMPMKEKYKSSYPVRMNCLLFLATNKPVKITDARSGIIRRLIDIQPSGRLIPTNRYFALTEEVKFEYGAIAAHCLHVYQSMGKNYYAGYRSMEMIERTDIFFNFVENSYDILAKQEYVTLKQAYDIYKEYCVDAGLQYMMPRHAFRDELRNYFEHFYPITRVNGKQIRSVFIDFIESKLTYIPGAPKDVDITTPPPKLTLDQTKSIFDEIYADAAAQYANDKETPLISWRDNTMRLKDLDTTKLHYVRLPKNHIVIDFDLKDEDGEKSFAKNLEAASKFPTTYAELSKSGQGIHLHYIYDGDTSKLSRIFDTNIEIKVFNGKASLRRKLTRCNNIPIATINSGLPLKEEKPVINFTGVASEKTIREQIERNLRKEIHSATRPSVDMIYKILDDAYNGGSKYDVSDMRPKILAFASNSTHQAAYCIKRVSEMKFKSDEPSDVEENSEAPIVFYDVEVFPNLFLINWKFEGAEHKCVRMINPTPQEVGELFKFRLIGFNCRRYDNHILYARYIGYTNEQLYELSQKIIGGHSRNAYFGEAYNISYTDVLDFASAGNKKSLKKLEIEMGLHHMELGMPWDQPVPEDQWERVAEYCDNDVISTEAAFNYLSADWTARQILADLAGMTVNDTTNNLTQRIIFGKNKHPQNEFCYRNMAEPVFELPEDEMEFLKEACPEMMAEPHGEAKSLLPYFPGYVFDAGKSTYRGDVASEGGYVYSEPGIYYDTVVLDISSMHPHSAIAECHFGPKYTRIFREIVEGRVDIKHKDWDAVKDIMGGRMVPYIEKVKNGDMSASALANALKTAINSVYGLTKASFDNPFRDPRNKDNIVAKRGALFMIDMKNAVQEKGFQVVHIKTDSIKIPNATTGIIKFVMEFGKRYGYTFEHEATYKKMCLTNKAVYIAQYMTKEECQQMYGYIPGDNAEHGGEWTATGAQFAQPYVFKSMFSHEAIKFEDMCETKASDAGDIYLDMNELTPEESHPIFIGKVGLFCPIKPGKGGGLLVWKKDDKFNAVADSKGYRWLEAETVKQLGLEDDIDINYYRGKVDDAVAEIAKFGDPEIFMADDKGLPLLDYPWCGKLACEKCNHYKVDCEGLPF